MGGMSEVYSAWDPTLERQVALKFLDLKRSFDLRAKERLLAEARAVAALEHPNICAIYEVGEATDGRSFLAMPYYDGVTLKALLARSGPLSIAEVVRYGSQVALGLSAAHERGIVHRDVKPGNVMITAGGVAKLLDFGIAIREDRAIGEPGQPVGTLTYMSPEQIAKERVGPASDVWSLGVMLYELLCGRHAFHAAEPADVVRKIRSAPPPPLLPPSGDVPTSLAALVRQCLDKAPRKRPRAAELAEELARSGGPTALSSGPGSRDTASSVDTGLDWGGLAEGPASADSTEGPPWRRRVGSLTLAAAGVAAVVMTVFDADTPGPDSVKPPEFRKVTSSGHVVSGEISPDGTRMAYVEVAPLGPTRLLVRDISGGRPLEVGSVAGDLHAIRWSPDGSRLLYSVMAEDGTNATYVVSRSGGAPQTVFAEGSEYTTWSPDGRLAASTAVHPNAVWISDLTSGQVQKLLVDIEPLLADIDWRPTGRLFAAVASTAEVATAREPAHYSLWTFTTDGREQRLLLEDSVPLSSVRWLGGGASLLYLRGASGSKELWRLDLTDSGARDGMPVLLLAGLSIARVDLGQVSLSATRDGTMLLYAGVTPASNLWRVEVHRDGGALRFEENRLTEGSSVLSNPAFSPDGARLAFGRGNQIQSDIVIASADASTPQRLTFLEGYATSPVWSPDGEEIVFVSIGGAGAEIWLARPGDAEPRRLADRASTSGWSTTTWAPGPRPLFQVNTWSNVGVLDPSTGQIDPLLSSDSLGWPHFPRYDPEGRRVAYYWNRRDTSRAGIWVTEPGRGDGHLVLPGRFQVPVSWTVDGRALWVWTLMGRRLALVSAAGEILGSGTLPFSSVGAVAVDPTDESLVVVVPEPRGDVWTIRGFDRTSN